MEFLEEKDVNPDGLLKEVEHVFTEIQIKNAKEIWGEVPKLVLMENDKVKALVKANANLGTIEDEKGCIETHGLVLLEDGSFYSIDYEFGEFRTMLISSIVAIQRILGSGNYGLLYEFNLIFLAMKLLRDQEKIIMGTK